MSPASAASLWKLVRIVLTALYLMVGWVLFTGTLDAYALGLGVLLSALVAVVTYGLFIEEAEAGRHALLPRLGFAAIFLLVLLGQIYIASFRVAALVFSGSIRPRMVHFRTRLRSDIARVALANAITLTPGTLTVDLDQDHLVVHWLDASTTHSRRAWELIAEPFERWLRRIWS